MAFIDKKNRIIDISLTDYGRDCMSKNRLRFAYYAFSDDLIDYSGSLSESLRRSASLDDTVWKNHVGVEAHPMRRTIELDSFLYTAADNRDVLPSLVANVTGSIALKRSYEDKSLADYVSQDLNKQEGYDVMIIADVDPVKLEDRSVQYAAEQKLERMSNSLNVIPVSLPVDSSSSSGS